MTNPDFDKDAQIRQLQTAAANLEGQVNELRAQLAEANAERDAARADAEVLRVAVQKSTLILSCSTPERRWIEIVFEKLEDSQALHGILVKMRYVDR